MRADIFGQRRQINRPRLHTLEPVDAERHASWLELFFDLVFVLDGIITDYPDRGIKVFRGRAGPMESPR